MFSHLQYNSYTTGVAFGLLDPRHNRRRALSYTLATLHARCSTSLVAGRYRAYYVSVATKQANKKAKMEMKA